MHPREEAGEILKLGPPASGEIAIRIDPGVAAAPFAAGTQTLLPGSAIQDRRHRDQDLALFVHKGQGRITLNERSMAVAPGVMLHVPRGTWYALRNTGTGLFQIAWVGSPGIELFFRDLSRVGLSPSSPALQELTQRHHVEFRPATAAPIPADPRRHRRHRGRRGGGRRPKPALSSTAAPPIVSAAPVSSAPVAATRVHRDRGPRRRRGHAGPRTMSPAAPGAKPSPSARTPPSGQRSGRPSQRPRKVKEVYMGGRWIRVEGDGPVIAPRRARPDPNRNRDDDTPPLSVAL